MQNNCDCNKQNKSAVAFNREISGSGTAVIARCESGQWRFFVNSNAMIRVKVINQGALSSLDPKIVWVHPNSGQEIQGSGAVILEAENLDVDTATVKTWNAPYLDRLEPVFYGDDVTESSNGAWVALGTNSGYPQPYTNYLRIYASEQIRIRSIDFETGNTILDLGIQPTDEIVLRDLVTQIPSYFQVRQAVSAGVPAYIRPIWFRE